MKKIAYLLSSILIISFVSCQKNNDYIKEELEKALPTIQLTSLGLVQQVGPFAQSDVILVTFGGAISKADPGAFDMAWYTAPASGPATLVDSVHFNGWITPASTANGNNAIATELIPTSYPNTSIITGNLTLKLTKLPAGSKSYTLRLYARTTSNKVGTVSVSKFVTIK